MFHLLQVLLTRCMLSEACRAVGHMPLSEYAPDEIRKSMFLTMIKKALVGGIWGRLQNYPKGSIPLRRAWVRLGPNNQSISYTYI